VGTPVMNYNQRSAQLQASPLAFARRDVAAHANATELATTTIDPEDVPVGIPIP